MPTTPEPTNRPKHDASYKRIFSHRRTVADLLRGFVGDLAHHLDFATLERLPASFVTERLGQRHADMLWKISTSDGRRLYLLILLEFQSTIDRRMALRMLDYTLRILDGLGEKELGSGGAYPPVLPVLVYNGKRPWNAPTDLFDLFTPVPDAILGYLPRHRYLLIDLRAQDPSRLAPENVVSLMAMLERSRSQGMLEELGAALADWLRRVGEADLLGSFEAWITQVLAKRVGPAGTVSELRIRNKEEETMSTLAERVKEWGDELNRQWLEKGIQQGLERGIEQGIEKGFRRGVKRGRREEVERQRALVRRLALSRFGPNIVESLGSLLDELSDPDRIAVIAAGVLECETADEFLAWAREA